MDTVIKYLKEEPDSSATYAYLADEPTMTNSRVEAMGTGSHTSYVKIATGFQNAYVFFVEYADCDRPKKITLLSNCTSITILLCS